MTYVCQTEYLVLDVVVTSPSPAHVCTNHCSVVLFETPLFRLASDITVKFCIPATIFHPLANAIPLIDSPPEMLFDYFAVQSNEFGKLALFGDTALLDGILLDNDIENPH